MQMSDQIEIAAAPERVFAALNDPEILRACIPGCEALDKTSDDGFNATVMAKVGPVKARFNGAVTLSDLNPPHGYTISGEGKGGAAGFAKGGAKVRLEPHNGGTVLHYDVKADVGGKLAQLGSRLIDGAARSLAKEFFSKFKQEVEGQAPDAAAGGQAVEAAPSPASASGLNWMLIAGAAVVGIVLLILLMR